MARTLSQATLDAIAAAVAVAVAQVLPAQAEVAPPASATPVHVGPSGKPDGRRFACTADGGCGRLLRSQGRAGIHGVELGGHAPAKPE